MVISFIYFFITVCFVVSVKIATNGLQLQEVGDFGDETVCYQ